MSKKILSILLALTILIGVIAVIPVSVSAQETGIAEVGADIDVSETGITQAEAVQWIKDRGDEGWWQDVDGVYGCQCVDLIHAYYQYFGYGILSGNAYQYQWDHTPSGSNWYYSGSPIPGSVFVQSAADAGFSTGHVGLVYAVDDTFVYTVETNIVASSNGYAGERGYANARYNKRYRSRITTYINPTYDNSTPPTNPWISASSTSIPVGGSVSFTFGADNATNYWIGIDRNESRIITEHVTSGVSYTFNEAGDYSAYITAYNYVGGVDSSKVYFTVNPKGHVMSDSEGAGQTIPDGDYWICSRIAQDYYLDAPGDHFNTADGANLQTWKWETGIPSKYDVFHFEYLNNGFYLITQMNTRKAIDVADASIFRGSNVQFYGVNKSNAQQWSIEKTDKGYKLRARCNGFYLDIDSNKYESGANVLTWEGWNGNCQFFSFIPYAPDDKPLSDGVYIVKSALGENCYLDVQGYPDSFKNYSNIEIYNKPDDRFQIEYVGNGYYRINEVSSKLAVEIINEGNYLDKNKNAILYGKTSSRGQLWRIKKNSDGTYFFVNKLSGYYLDVYDGKTDNGTNVHIHPYNGSNAQKWKPIRVLQDSMVTVSDVEVSSMDATVNPKVTVKVDNTTLKTNTDYTVKVTADIESGKGTITVTGKGDYCDTVTKSFNITYNPPAILGDVDDDGEVGVIDATYIQRYDAGFNVPISEEDILARGDVDGDEEVTVLDATYIQRYDAGFDTPYPIGEVIT